MLKKTFFLATAISFLTILPSKGWGDGNLENNKDQAFLEYLKRVMPGNLSQVGTYMIIPANSCSYCIERTLAFIDSSNFKHVTRYILLGQSQEEIELIFGKEAIKKEYVFLDSSGSWEDASVDSELIPKIFYVVEDRIVNEVELTPENVDDQLQTLEDWNFGWLYSYLDPSKNLDSKRLAGNPAPVINSVTIHREVFDLSTTDFEVLILSFWIRGCMSCLLEIESLNKISEEYAEKGVRVLAVYNEGIESYTRFVSANERIPQPEFPVIVNGQGFIDDYGIRVFPATIVVDEEKDIVAVFGYIALGNSDPYELGLYYQALKGSTNRILWSSLPSE